MKNKINRFLTKPWAAYTVAVCCGVVLYVCLNNITVVKGVLDSVIKFLSPVFTGIIIAYLFSPVEEFFETRLFEKLKKESARRTWAAVFTVALFALVVIILLVSLIPSLVKSISRLVSQWDAYTAKALELIGKAEDFAISHNMSIDLTSIRGWVVNSMDKVVDLLKDNSDVILSTLGSIGSSVSNFAIGVLFGFCFLFAKNTLMGFVNRLRSAFIKDTAIRRQNELLERCHNVFIRYLVCTLADALIIGFCVLVFALIMSMPYAPLIAVICGLTNILPTFGPWIGTGIGIFFLILDKPSNALWFVVFCCVLQSLDGMVIKPRLFKNGLGIPAVWTLVLIILGGKIAGVAGIILSIPFGAVFTIIYKETIVPKLEKRRKEINNITDEKTEENCG